MTLREWFRRYHNRPLKVAAVFLLAIWAVLAARSYYVITEKQNAYVKQTADLLSLTIQQKNRIMAESLLETLISQGGASSVAICRGDKQEIGANQTLTGCSDNHHVYEKSIGQPIAGSSELVLRARFNWVMNLSPVFSTLGFSMILVLLGFYFIQTAQNRMKDDVFDPLVGKLLGDEILEIKELSDLRNEIRRAQQLEAQKAVTLAIQENNQQVAHDIRSPVETLEELMKLVELKDKQLNAVIVQVIRRIHFVAESLLGKENTYLEEELKETYDVADSIRNIAYEKKMRFKSGDIQVDVPKSFSISTPMLEQRLVRVLSNLIDNAIYACKQGGIIELSLSIQDGTTRILVKDNGYGIPQDALNRIGTKNVSTRTDSKGSGLGVYSAKKSLSSIGGDLKYSSEVGKGTIVTVEFPIYFHGDSSTECDLILIDDKNLVRMSWQLAAEQLGLTARVFSSIEEFYGVAPTLLKTKPVFVDSNLGKGVRGEAHANRIRNELGFKHIFLTTGYHEYKDRKIEHIDGVISKSFQEAYETMSANGLVFKQVAVFTT